jgi:hypothetical protein
MHQYGTWNNATQWLRILISLPRKIFAVSSTLVTCRPQASGARVRKPLVSVWLSIVGKIYWFG